MIDLAAMTAPTWLETSGLVGGDRPLQFGVVPLQPADFAEYAGTLFGLVAASQDSETSERELSRADREHIQIIACLAVRYVREPEGEQMPIRLVLNEADHDPSAGRLHVTWLTEDDLGWIAGHAMGRYAEAALRARRFRQRSAADSHDRRNGAPVCDDAGPMAHEAR
ncbi:hypothetical protein [Sulfitobacter dubius]|uniref:hypothetical protein n=1 Tax=Sulfitobacter dubius TaxID=218673 RepID=UPI0030DC2DA1